MITNALKYLVKNELDIESWNQGVLTFRRLSLFSLILFKLMQVFATVKFRYVEDFFMKKLMFLIKIYF